MKKEFKGFIVGVIVTAMLMSTVVFAEGIKKNIEVLFNSVNIAVNGQTVQAENILYNGATYVHIDEFAEMLDKEVKWDKDKTTVKINDKDNTKVNTKTGYAVKDEKGKVLYTFKINKITNMTERNQFSDKKPAQVILIDYTYTNVSSEEDIHLFDSYFKVIDSKNKLAGTYPNSVTKHADSVPTGVTCDAQMIFGLENKSDKVTIKFYDNMFNSKPTTTLVIPITK